MKVTECGIERFSIKCGKNKTKVITTAPANQNKGKHVLQGANEKSNKIK